MYGNEQVHHTLLFQITQCYKNKKPSYIVKILLIRRIDNDSIDRDTVSSGLGQKAKMQIRNSKSNNITNTSGQVPRTTLREKLAQR